MTRRNRTELPIASPPVAHARVVRFGAATDVPHDWREALLLWERAGIPHVLVTVIEALGSTPRELGAKMVVRADAQSGYPNRPVQLIISYGAGSTGDVSMRILTEQLTAKLGQPFLVINKPGAGGVAAAQAAATTAPDGYTLLLTGNSSTISVALFKTLPYNILTDFDAVSMVANFDMVVLVKAGSPQTRNSSATP